MGNSIEKLMPSKWYADNMKRLASIYADPNCTVSGKYIFEQIASNKKLYLKAIELEKKQSPKH